MPVPEIDNEILRALYKVDMDVAKAYDTIMTAQQLINEMFPIKFTQRAHEIVQSGCFYIAGRDRHYRPVLVATPAIMQAMDP